MVDIVSGGNTTLSVVEGVIGTGRLGLEVTIGRELNLEAVNPAPRTTTDFWVVLTGTAGGSDTPDHVNWIGVDRTPPAQIYWNGDVIGGQEWQLYRYLRAERFYMDNKPLVDEMAIFRPNVYNPATFSEYDRYWTMPLVEFLTPGMGTVTGLPDGNEIINIDEALLAPYTHEMK